MATLTPFRALRPPADLAAHVASPPYDVVSTREARALAKGNPDSFLRVSRPEIDLPEGTDEHADAVYAKGAENLAELVRRGVLREDPEPRFYVYAQRMGAHRQTGLVACASVEEYDRDVIKKHEKTRADKEDDRIRHIDTLSAHDEPVFLTYRAAPEIDRAIDEVKRAAPEVDLVTAGRRRPPALDRALPRSARASRRCSRACPRSTSRTATTAPPPPPAFTRSAPAAPASTAPSSRSSSPTTRCRSSRTTGSCAIRAAGVRASCSARSAR